MIKTGIDIISQRITKLEKETIRSALELPKNSTCLDLGCGQGYLGIILVFLHQKVYFIDQKINWKLRVLKKLFRLQNMILIQKDIRKMIYQDFPDNISLIYSGRFLHYMKYNEANNLLKILRKKSSKNGKIFLSVSGINSELGNGYLGNGKKIEERYDFLTKDHRNRFKIQEKVTLYNEQELQNLIQKYFQIESIWQSDFGNLFVTGILK